MRRPELLPKLFTLEDETLPSKFSEPPTSKGLTLLAKSIFATPDTSSCTEDEEMSLNMLNAEAVWEVDKAPGRTTRARNDDEACVASAASAMTVLVFNSVSACALTESRAEVLAMEEVYNDDKDSATLETSLRCDSESPVKAVAAVENSPDKVAESVIELTSMSCEQKLTEAPRESIASTPKDFTPLAKVTAENNGADDTLSKTPFAEGLQDDVVKEISWYFKGPSSSLQLAVELEASFKAMRSFVCMAVTAQPSRMLPTHSSDVSDSTAPTHVGGKFAVTDNEASAETLDKVLVTRQVNVIAEEIWLKNAAFTIKLGAWSDVKVSAAVRTLDEDHSNLYCASNPGDAWTRRRRFWFSAMRGSEDVIVSKGGVPATGTTMTLAL